MNEDKFGGKGGTHKLILQIISLSGIDSNMLHLLVLCHRQKSFQNLLDRLIATMQSLMWKKAK